LSGQPAISSKATSVRKPMAAFLLSLIAGVMVIIQGLVRLVQSRALEISGITDKISGRVLAGLGLLHLGAVALLFGALILVGAIILYKTTMTLAGALVVLVFSILSIVSGGLFSFLGLGIGIIGAILGLLKK
jgi:hypothetical protein